MKSTYIYIIIAIIVLLGVFYFVSQSDDGMITNNETDTMNEMDQNDQDETASSSDQEQGASEGEEVTVDLDGFNYGYSEEEIRVQEGDTVTINLTSTDGFHDWVVDEFDASTEQIQSGETTSVTFVADEAGTYEYYCSVGNHRAQGMVGTLIVE